MIDAVLVLVVLAGAYVGRPRRARPLRTHPARERRRRRCPPWAAARNAAGAEADALRSLPELLDLLAVAAAAGLPTAPAVLAVAERAPPAWAAPLDEVRTAMERGALVVDALDHLVGRHGDLARPLVGVLRAALDDGDALGPGLGRLCVDARDLRRRHAEEAARRLPVRLLLPLVTCSLPAFAVLTVVPILAGALTGLRLPS